MRFDTTFPKELKTDAYLIVATIGEDLQLGPVMGPEHGKKPPAAVANPIFVDVDGGGFKPNGGYDRYVSVWDVAHLAKQISGSKSEIGHQQTSPKNQIVTEKLRRLGMTFGGQQLLEATERQFVEAVGSA